MFLSKILMKSLYSLMTFISDDTHEALQGPLDPNGSTSITDNSIMVTIISIS